MSVMGGMLTADIRWTGLIFLLPTNLFFFVCSWIRNIRLMVGWGQCNRCSCLLCASFILTFSILLITVYVVRRSLYRLRCWDGACTVYVVETELVPFTLLRRSVYRLRCWDGACTIYVVETDLVPFTLLRRSMYRLRCWDGACTVYIVETELGQLIGCKDCATDWATDVLFPARSYNSHTRV
jgi:hypothetical protein